MFFKNPSSSFLFISSDGRADVINIRRYFSSVAMGNDYVIMPVATIHQ
jgi:hypothetical protein